MQVVGTSNGIDVRRCFVLVSDALPDTLVKADDGGTTMPTNMQIVASANLPTKYGPARIDVFDSSPDGDGELVVVSHRLDPGDVQPVPLVRLHSVCLTGDVLGSLNCDCGPQLQESLAHIMAAPYGVLVYVLNHEGRGIGLAKKVLAIQLQSEQGLDTVEANLALGLPVDARDFRHCADALRRLGISRIRLLTNNPDKVRVVTAAGVVVVERVPLTGFVNQHNARYLDTKRDLLGHLLGPSTGPDGGMTGQPGRPLSSHPTAN
jgi:3,4-dihydroxy 2-butanone 4-phosphate synthase/GTP cyclohydrolase II